MDDAWHKTELRVRYAETDQMGIVHHSNYIVWFEVARSDYCRTVGVPYTEMEANDVQLIVAEVSLRYKRPAFYDDLLLIRVRSKEIRSRSLRFAYEVIRKSDSELLATGETLHVVTDRSRRVRSLPPEYQELFNA
ncbi:MAG TPA: thioesterase family protein [Pyrinomonadaceae bacterium]|nr:thioesterase family protein [Pyrinomonadaceae bacterium]